MHLNEFIDLVKFQEVVDFGRSFCFSWKERCPNVEHLVREILFPYILFY